MGDNVVDFAKFKLKKQIAADRKVGNKKVGSPSTATHKISTTPGEIRDNISPGEVPDVELAARIERIKSSIDRINQLTAELKNLGIKPKGEDE